MIQLVLYYHSICLDVWPKIRDWKVWNHVCRQAPPTHETSLKYLLGKWSYNSVTAYEMAVKLSYHQFLLWYRWIIMKQASLSQPIYSSVLYCLVWNCSLLSMWLLFILVSSVKVSAPLGRAGWLHGVGEEWPAGGRGVGGLHPGQASLPAALGKIPEVGQFPAPDGRHLQQRHNQVCTGFPFNVIDINVIAQAIG